MPTSQQRLSVGDEALRAIIERASTGIPGGSGLGLEVELFAFGPGRTPRRTPLGGEVGTIALLATAADPTVGAAAGEVADESGWLLRDAAEGRLSFEPGGQIELSTRYEAHPAAAMDAAERSTTAVADVLAGHDVRLVAAGLDVWTPGTAAQQRSGARYPAMDRGFAARGPAGRTMMRDTCALQLNLDLGTGVEAADRWLVANLLAPVATATFACSPSPDGDVRSQRSLMWQDLDPSRTGFVLGPGACGQPLADQLERFALDADVLLIDGADASTLIPPRLRFRDWLRDGHPRLGWPTEDDLTLHLSTLFPEVRPRGYLEIRSIDAVPARWRRAVVTLYLGAVYDATARGRILEVLTAHPASLPNELRRAAMDGVADASRCAQAVEVWSYALEGAARLPVVDLDREDLHRTERFLDRFTLRGRCPADELLEVLRREGPAGAWDWSVEPTTTRQVVR